MSAKPCMHGHAARTPCGPTCASAGRSCRYSRCLLMAGTQCATQPVGGCQWGWLRLPRCTAWDGVGWPRAMSERQPCQLLLASQPPPAALGALSQLVAPNTSLWSRATRPQAPAAHSHHPDGCHVSKRQQGMPPRMRQCQSSSGWAGTGVDTTCWPGVHPHWCAVPGCSSCCL